MADVVIVGCGISGALVAYEAVRRGFAVTMLDRRAPLHGSTIASTALLIFELDVALHDLAARIGTRRAARAWQRSNAAVGDLVALIERERITCGLSPQNSLYVAGNRYGSRALAREAAMRARYALPGELIPKATLHHTYGVDRTAAIASDGCAVADPARLAAGILRRVTQAGTSIHHDANVIDVQQHRRGVTVSTEQGFEVTANAVVFCTGYEVPRMLPKRSHRIDCTWVLAGTPRHDVPHWLRTTVMWEASEPYLYLRLANDGVLVAGGHDERNARIGSSNTRLFSKARRIAKDVDHLLGGFPVTITHRWAGLFGNSPTGLPTIGKLPGYRDAYVVAGFGGNGITYSMIASQVIGAALSGERDSDAGLYAVEP